jgi:beta-N-acetylhexosaminidase
MQNPQQFASLSNSLQAAAMNKERPIPLLIATDQEHGVVASLTQVQVNGLHSGGAAATAKHFPGHGDTDVDSHFGLPIISRSKQHLGQAGGDHLGARAV